MRYFRVEPDPKVSKPWFLEEPTTATGESIDAREFTSGVRYSGPLPSFVPLQEEGKRLQFNLGALDMPVVSEVVGEKIKRLASHDVELFPVLVDSTIPGFEILNVVVTEKCLDEKKSEVMRWEKEDDRPDKIGQYRMVTNLAIDPARVRGRHVFRIKGWEVALIVSEVLVEQLSGLRDLGVTFSPVT